MVVSIGDDNDKGLLIWETHSPRIISANLMKKSSINGVIFLAQSDEIISFITYGTNRYLKLWKIKIEKDHLMTSYSIFEGLSKIEAG